MGTEDVAGTKRVSHTLGGGPKAVRHRYVRRKCEAFTALSSQFIDDANRRCVIDIHDDHVHSGSRKPFHESSPEPSGLTGASGDDSGATGEIFRRYIGERHHHRIRYS